MKNKFNFILISSAIVLISIGLFFYFKQSKEENLNQEFINFNLQRENLRLLVADEQEEWARGLSGIYELKDADGMIFIFPDKQIRHFWNKDTHLDLVVYWLLDDEIVGVDYLPSIEKTEEVITITSPKEVNKVIEYVIKKEDEIFVFQPLPNQKITSPLKIKGIARGNWFFEAEFLAELYGNNQNKLGLTILRAIDDWMTPDFVKFEGELNFTTPNNETGILRFLNSNPSGLPEHQKIYEISVKFEQKTRKVSLYFYNPLKDKDENGNIKCSEDGILPVEREISITKTPIQDTINLLLKGKDILTKEEIEQGITTEFPLEGLELKSASLKDGILTLQFDDPYNKTSGGSCRVKILWLQIEKTAKQFDEVKEVKFSPEEIFQP